MRIWIGSFRLAPLCLGFLCLGFISLEGGDGGQYFVCDALGRLLLLLRPGLLRDGWLTERLAGVFPVAGTVQTDGGEKVCQTGRMSKTGPPSTTARLPHAYSGD